MQEKELLKIIPHEMTEAALGSFPLSPAVMGGHYSVANLYWHYRQEVLSSLSIKDVFNTETPEIPKMALPEGHIHIAQPNSTFKNVWEIFIDKSFITRPKVDVQASIHNLITITANADVEHYAGRLAGTKSQVARGGMAPSLLKAFAFEQRFPHLKYEFNQWLIASMAQEILEASKNNFNDAWANGLKALVLMWDKQFPEDPFVGK